MSTAVCPGDDKVAAAAEQTHSCVTCPSCVSLAHTGRSKPLRNQFGCSVFLRPDLFHHHRGDCETVTCMSQKQFNPFSADFFFQGKKLKWSMIGVCQLAHMLLMVCKHFSTKRVLRNASAQYSGTPEAARGSGWEEALANLWYWTKVSWRSTQKLSCFSLLLAASAFNASLAEIFLSLLALDSQTCLG